MDKMFLFRLEGGAAIIKIFSSHFMRAPEDVSLEVGGLW